MSAPVRRTLAAFASLLFATLGLAVTTTPAHAASSAVAPSITSVAICDNTTGEWVINWKFSSGSADATITNIVLSPSTALTIINNGAVVPAGKTLTGLQRVTVGNASLSLDVGSSTIPGSWSKGYANCYKDSAYCKPLAAAVLLHDSFSGPNGFVHIQRNGTQPFKALCAPLKLTLVSYYALSVGFQLPQYVFDASTQDFTPLTYELTFKIALPPCYTQVDFVTGLPINPLTDSSGLFGDRKIGSSSGTGAYSSGVAAWYNGNGADNTSGVCTNPAATADPECDGSGTVHLNNSSETLTASVQVKKNGDSGFTAYTLPKKSSDSFNVIDGQWPVEVNGTENFHTKLDWSWPADECKQPELAVDPDCKNLVLKVTNPNSKTVGATATYGGASQTKSIAKGATETFSFPAGTGPATIALNGAPYWTSLTTTFSADASCHLADTGVSATTVTVIGASLAAAGALLIYVVARTMGRRRRVA